jgi:hypothetical protein
LCLHHRHSKQQKAEGQADVQVSHDGKGITRWRAV